MINIIKRDVGITICPESAVENELTGASLIKLPWDIGVLETSVLMIWHSDKWCSPILSRFMEISRDVFARRCVELMKRKEQK